MRISNSSWIWIGLVVLAGCGGGGDSGGGTPPVDTTPNAFSFAQKTGAALAEPVISGDIVVSGINSGAPVSVTGGEYSIDGGVYTGAAGSVTNNQVIRVRLMAASQFSTVAQAVLTIGGVSATFSAVTVAADTTPDAFGFPRRSDAARGTWINSNTVTVSGINTPAPISIENGEYSIDGGAFTSAAGSIDASQSLTIRAQSSSIYSRITRARIMVGTLSVEFEVTSELPRYIPDVVAFDGQDIIYLLDKADKFIFRWSLAQERYLDSFVLDAQQPAPTTMAHSGDHQRLYLGFGAGAIRYLDLVSGDGVLAPFATLAMDVEGLAAAGRHVLAQDGSGAWATHYIFDRNGTLTDQKDWNYYSREYAWDAVTSRIYHLRDSTSPNDLHFEVIDQATGKIVASGETPYHGDYAISTPIRVSADGRQVLLGGGDIYDQATLEWTGALGLPVTDARWMGDGSLVVLATDTHQTMLRHVGDRLANLEQLNYAGRALRVLGSDSRMAVLVVDDDTVKFHTYIPSDDSDRDGIVNTADAFPVDAAASVDTDLDGYPDAWNAGHTGLDSTTGLQLDPYPRDSACWLPAHGNGIQCNHAAAVPDYVPDQVVSHGDVVYLLSSANERVYRWSISAGRYLNPYVVGLGFGFTARAPTTMAYSGAHRRLYLGYHTGAIRFIDTDGSNAREMPFANASLDVWGLAAVGNFVLAQDYSGGWATHYVFDGGGRLTDMADSRSYSRDYAWDPVNSRVYYFRDDSSPNDLHYAVIDQATGRISAPGESPYHGSYDIEAPIRVSPDGQQILLGTGHLYRQSDLTWAGTLGSPLVDARWMSDASLVTLMTVGDQTVLRRLGANRAQLEQRSYAGEALRVVGSDSVMVVLAVQDGTVRFHPYTVSNDSDGDGVPNTQDAFPLDRAASVDSDRDGYPDSWNAGHTQADSTTGLSLDAFSQDSACYLPAHGSGGVCNHAATVPSYIPDAIVSAGDTVYLLSTANARVFRWSMATGAYLNPLVVGINQGSTILAPTKITYSGEHQRLYLGYSTGAIQSIDVNANNAPEVPFAAIATGVDGLAAVGNFVLAQDDSGAWATHYIFNGNGVLTDLEDWNYHSREYAWDPGTSRVYFFRDDTTPNDLHYEVIDQSTGLIGGKGESPHHGTFDIRPPIRLSPDGGEILLGSGDFYQQPGLAMHRSLGKGIIDAHWHDGALVTLDPTGLMEVRDPATLAVLRSDQYVDQPLRMVFGQSEACLIHVVDNTTAFLRLPFTQ